MGGPKWRKGGPSERTLRYHNSIVNIHFSRSFEKTINDRGQCYTFNNVDLHGHHGGDEQPKIRTVQGCGKSKGLRLVLDTHMLGSRMMRREGYMVYVTVNGVITHKVPFKVDLPFHGEYNFYLHGLHFITSSQRFRDWNEDMQVSRNDALNKMKNL